jgi:hypothetical protein
VAAELSVPVGRKSLSLPRGDAMQRGNVALNYCRSARFPRPQSTNLEPVGQFGAKNIHAYVNRVALWTNRPSREFFDTCHGLEIKQDSFRRFWKAKGHTSIFVSGSEDGCLDW